MIFRFVFDLFIAGHLKCPKTGQVATFDLPCLFWCLVWSCSLFSVMSVMNEMNGVSERPELYTKWLILITKHIHHQEKPAPPSICQRQVDMFWICAAPAAARDAVPTPYTAKN